MTFEELKEEAKRQGYKLIKIIPKETFLPCVCGCNKRTWWINPWDETKYVECQKCGLKTEGVSTSCSDNEVIKQWNKMVLKKKQKQEQKENESSD